MLLLTVEAYVMNEYDRDFHGERMRCILVGYIRPEMRFSNIGDLITRIKTDVALSSSTLNNPMLKCYEQDEFMLWY